jgi:hypothetical protein
VPLYLPTFTGPQSQETIAVGADDIPVTLTSGGTAGTKGSYTQLIASTAADAYCLWLWARGVSASAGDGRCLIDIAVGPSGSERIVLPDLNFGAAPATASMERQMGIPIYVPKGSRIAARCQRDTASGTVTIGWMLDEQPVWPGTVGQIGTSYGVNATNTRGVVITTGSGAFGTWQQVVASTTSPHGWWWPGIDVGGDTTQSAVACIVQLGVGASGSEQVIGTWHFRATAAEELGGPHRPLPVYHPLPAGVRLAVRASNGSNSLGVVVHALS